MFRRKWNRNTMASILPGFSNDMVHHTPGKDWRMHIDFPPVNIAKNGKEYKVSFAVPGFDKEDFDIEIIGTELIVKAETRSSREEITDTFTHQEFDIHSFKRSFHLPDNIITNEIDAEYKNGILTIKLPMVEEVAESKHIPVEG